MYTTPSQAVTKHWWRLSTEPLFTRCHQTGRVTESHIPDRAHRIRCSHQWKGRGKGGGAAASTAVSQPYTLPTAERIA